MVYNNAILNVERGHNSQPLPLPLAIQYTRQGRQVNIRCSLPVLQLTLTAYTYLVNLLFFLHSCMIQNHL